MLIIKNFLSLAWQEFIFGGHIVAIGAMSIVYAVALLLSIKIAWDCLVIVYLGMYTGYLYNYYKEIKTDFSTNPLRTKHLKKYSKYIPIIILISFFTILIIISFNKILVFYFGLILFCLSLSYTLFFKNFTKKIIFFKNFFVSSMWASLIIFLPLYYSLSITSAIILITTFVLLRLLTHEIFCDIKDAESDKKKEMLTMPVIFKKRVLFNFLIILNLLSGIPIIIGVYFKVLPHHSMALLLLIIYGFYYFKKPANVFWADGECLLWLPLVFFGKILI